VIAPRVCTQCGSQLVGCQAGGSRIVGGITYRLIRLFCIDCGTEDPALESVPASKSVLPPVETCVGTQQSTVVPGEVIELRPFLSRNRATTPTAARPSVENECVFSASAVT
jgi:hypothetical protein